MSTITLTVVSFNGQPSDGSLSTKFDELGGLIGRADSNQLVLADPDRTISRVHAQVVFRGKCYVILDRGSTAILVNGKPAGTDRELPLADGDQVQIGGYELQVRLGNGSSSGPVDPFADLFGAPPLATAGTARRPGMIDPLDLFGSAPASPPPAQAVAPAAAGIPNDWNPFAPDPVSAPSARAAATSSSLGLELGAAAPAPLLSGLASTAKVDSLDALFGLGAGGGAGAGDPFANSPLGQASAQPNMAADADPMKALARAPQATAPTLPDDLSDLHRPFVPARGVSSPPAPALPQPAADPADRPRVFSAVMSWDEEPGDARTVIRPAPPRDFPPAGAGPAAHANDRHEPSQAAAAPEPTPTPTLAPTGPWPPVVQGAPPAQAAGPAMPAAAQAWVPPGPPMPRPAQAAVPQAAAAEVDALLQALREGLDTPELRLDALTPDLMRLIGGLLREAASGTVDLLLARAAFKNEMRAALTMIAARENNPLKFSPSAEVALLHLLAPPARGFLAAAPAMRDAYTDLRAHQYGMVAGMRSALDGVLARFDPSQLESQLTKGSVFDSLIPGSRKARLWEAFVDHFDRIRDEAADDFQTLFGRAFLAAYEEHSNQIEQENGA